MYKYPKIETLFKRDEKFKVTNEIRLPEFENIKKWLITEKIDGTNIRIIYTPDDKLLIRGRTDKASIPTFLLEELQNMFTVEKIKTILDNPIEKGLCLYGEGYGAKIQKGGGNYRPDQGFVLFDVKIGDWWLQRNDVAEIAAKLGIDIVPTIGTGSLIDMVTMVQKGFKSLWGDFIAEGIVARPATELKDRGGHRIITKIKHKDFKEKP